MSLQKWKAILDPMYRPRAISLRGTVPFCFVLFFFFNGKNLGSNPPSPTCCKEKKKKKLIYLLTKPLSESSLT